MIAYVAAGRYLGCYEYQINSWDCLAGICMVRETGGWTNDFLAKDGLHSGNSNYELDRWSHVINKTQC